VELVASALAYSKYNPLIRLVMRRIALKEGGDTDTSRGCEYTDWRAIAAFASDLALGAVSRCRPEPGSGGLSACSDMMKRVASGL
jgi:hypothetical protein